MVAVADDSKKDTNPKDACGTQKVPFSTLSGRVLAAMATGMHEGALKYGRFNWRVKKVLASVYYDATLRHLTSWYEGEDIDPDSGLNHITKALTSLHVLMDAILMSKWVDDRPPRGNNVHFMSEYNSLVIGLLKKYPNPVAPYTHFPLISP